MKRITKAAITHSLWSIPYPSSAENPNINGEAWKFIEKIGKRVIYHLRPQSFDAMLVFFDVLIALFLNRGADRAAHP